MTGTGFNQHGQLCERCGGSGSCGTCKGKPRTAAPSGPGSLGAAVDADHAALGGSWDTNRFSAEDIGHLAIAGVGADLAASYPEQFTGADIASLASNEVTPSMLAGPIPDWANGDAIVGLAKAGALDDVDYLDRHTHDRNELAAYGVGATLAAEYSPILSGRGIAELHQAGIDPATSAAYGATTEAVNWKHYHLSPETVGEYRAAGIPNDTIHAAHQFGFAPDDARAVLDQVGPVYRWNDHKTLEMASKSGLHNNPAKLREVVQQNGIDSLSKSESPKATVEKLQAALGEHVANGNTVAYNPPPPRGFSASNAWYNAERLDAGGFNIVPQDPERDGKLSIYANVDRETKRVPVQQAIESLQRQAAVDAAATRD